MRTCPECPEPAPPHRKYCSDPCKARRDARYKREKRNGGRVPPEPMPPAGLHWEIRNRRQRAWHRLENIRNRARSACLSWRGREPGLARLLDRERVRRGLPSRRPA